MFICNFSNSRNRNSFLNVKNGVLLQAGAHKVAAQAFAATLTILLAVNPAFAVTTTANTFLLLDPGGNFTGETNDVIFSWDGTLYTDPVTQTAPNITLASATPTPLFGFTWTIHDARAFDTGSYSFSTTRGNTLNLNVGENQIGAHVLFDWNRNNDIDMVLLWDIDGNNLVSTDGNGDEILGIPMADGPFEGFSPNFNVSAVPVPAAAWLFTSGLLGMAGISRRRLSRT